MISGGSAGRFRWQSAALAGRWHDRVEDAEREALEKGMAEAREGKIHFLYGTRIEEATYQASI
jgi:hypothetical protein